MSDIYRMSVGRANGGRMLARIEGEIDLASAPAIGADLRVARGRGDLAIDLSDVAFIDSAGLRMLVDLARGADGARIPLTLVAPAGSTARRMLQVTGIEPLFEVLDSVGALRRAAPGPGTGPSDPRGA